MGQVDIARTYEAVPDGKVRLRPLWPFARERPFDQDQGELLPRYRFARAVVESVCDGVRG